MSKQRAIRLLNSQCSTFTTRQKAIRLVESGRARYVNESTVEFIVEDPRHLAVVASAEKTLELSSPKPAVLQSPRLGNVVPFQQHSDGMMQTFLPYPQPGSFKRAA